MLWRLALATARGLAHSARASGTVRTGGAASAPAQAKIRATSRSARSAPGPSVSGSRAGPDQVDRVPARAQGLQVVGDGQVGAVGLAGDLRAADQLGRSVAREQLESDQVDRGAQSRTRRITLGVRRQCTTSVSASELILPDVRLGLEVGDGHRQDHDVDRVRLEDLLRGSPHSRRRCRRGAGRAVSRSRCAEPAVAELRQPIELGGGLGGVEVEPGEPQERKLGRAGVDVPDRRPPARQASVIAAANRPEETLVMRRTSSIGAIVPPPVTTTFIAGRAPLLALARDRRTPLAWPDRVRRIQVRRPDPRSA